MAIFSMDRRIIGAGTKPWGYADGQKAAAAWLPSQLSDLVLWLDADDTDTITLDGSDNVEQWDDKSGLNKHATQTTSESRPTYAISGMNGKGAISFDGNNFLNCHGSLFPATGNFDFFIVSFLAGVPNGEHHVLLQQGTSASDCFLVYSNTTYGDANNQFRIYLVSQLLIGDDLRNTTHILRIGRNGNIFAYSKDAATAVNGTSSASIPQQSSRIGVRLDDTTTMMHYKGNISECILYSRTLTTQEREQIEGYLSHKWGLEANLPSGHPYKDSAP